MNRIFRLLLISSVFISLFGVSPARTMYVEYTAETYDELWEYIEDHDILIQLEDNTKFTSLDAIKKEIEKRKKNWQELVTQEWGVRISHTEFFFGDLNLNKQLGFWDAQAVVFTPFRTDLALLAMMKKAFGDEKVQEEFEKMKRDLEKLEEVGKPERFYLKFVVRIPVYQWDFPSFSYLALLRYEDKELEPSFSYQRESEVYYDHKIKYNETYKEKKEFTELGLNVLGWIAIFLYLDFVIEDAAFDPQGEVRLYLLTERGEEGVFTVDLSKMR